MERQDQMSSALQVTIVASTEAWRELFVFLSWAVAAISSIWQWSGGFQYDRS